MAKSKKQTKEDKAFIAKIASLGINVGASGGKHSFPETATCPDCGTPGKLIGVIPIPVYAASGPGPDMEPPTRRERKTRKQVVEGDSFAA